MSSSSTSYSEGERVLCYEPDPNKVKVVYEAKILQVAQAEIKGEETLYLVHFQVT